MSKNAEFGREPITVCTLKQDKCSLTWSEAPCEGGRTNYFEYSQDFSQQPPWQIPRYTVTDGQTDPFAGTLAWQFENNTAAAVNSVTVFPQPVGIINDIYYSGYFRTLGNIDTVVLFVPLDGGGQAAAAVDLTDGSITLGSNVPNYGSAEDPDSAAVEDLGGGWYRFEIWVVNSRITEALLGFEFLDGPFAPAVGQQALVYGIQLSARANQEYLPTNGQPATLENIQPCFNTRQTCQDPDNYTIETLPINFVTSRSAIPSDDYYIPLLESVSVSPGELNPGGANRSVSALGKRGTFSAKFKDAPHNDRLVDPYFDQRPYDPFTRSTFWSKWRARNPYYLNRFFDIKTGYLDEDGEIVDDITKSFVITGFSGPDSAGNVTINGKDILTLAEDAKAKAPFLSVGELSATLTAGESTSFTVAPAGAGDNYPSSGFVRIEKEVIEYDSRTGDTFSDLTRARFGTEAKEYDAGTQVQECIRGVSESPQDILFMLLNTYAGIPSIYLDKVNWDLEPLPNLYTYILSEPLSVSQLISEMCEQMFFSIWWDERDSLVKMQAVRAADEEEVTTLDDNTNLLKNSIKWEDRPDELVTQVWVYYGQINPTVKLDQASNYAIAYFAIDQGAESDEKNDTRKIKVINSRWIDAANVSAAENLADAILNRYVNIPRRCSFSLDAKDRDLWLGDFIRITNRLNVDEFGLPAPVNMQVFKASDSVPGSQLSYVAQQYITVREDDPNNIELAIATNFLNVDLLEFYKSQKGDPTPNTTVTFTIRNGAIIGGDATDDTINQQQDQRSDSNDFYDAGNSFFGTFNIGQVNALQRAGIGSPRTFAAGDEYPSGGSGDVVDGIVKEYPVSVALRTGVWPASVTLKMIIEPDAQILGEGGNGSAHTFQPDGGTSRAESVPGGDGGHAMLIENAIEITNGGVIAAGGGGGGNVNIIFSNGALIVNGGGGAGSLQSRITNNKVISTGTVDQLEIAGTGSADYNDSTNGGDGGEARRRTSLGSVTFTERYNKQEPDADGGNFAQNGEIASVRNSSSSGSDTTTTYGTGGTAGDAITSGASLITWNNKGTVIGAEN